MGILTPAGEEAIHDREQDCSACSGRGEHEKNEAGADERGRTRDVEPPILVGEEVEDRAAEERGAVHNSNLCTMHW